MYIIMYVLGKVNVGRAQKSALRFQSEATPVLSTLGVTLGTMTPVNGPTMARVHMVVA